MEEAVEKEPIRPVPAKVASMPQVAHGLAERRGAPTPRAAIQRAVLPDSGMPAGTFPVGLFGKFLAKDGAENTPATRAHNENADTFFKILDLMVPS
jgi:hypothetical protein